MGRTNQTVTGTIGGRSRGWMICVLMLVNAVNLADRQGLAALVPVLKRDLRLTDTDIGVLHGLAFAILYTLLGWPIARLSERANRTRIISTAVALFACFALLASRARSFTTLLISRAGVAIGDAGFGPPVGSLVADYYPIGKRASAITLVWLGAPVGALAGAALAGRVAQHGDWRVWFVGLAIPALIAAVLILTTLREPARGSFDAVGTQSGPIPSARATLRFLFGKRSMRHVLLGAAVAATALHGIGQFWARYLVAVFGIGTAKAGSLLGMMVVVAMSSGFLLGGFGVDSLARRDRRWFAWGPSVGLFLSTPLFLIGLARSGLIGTLCALVLAHIALFTFYTPTLALAQNMVDNRMRASSSFAANVVLGLIGAGLGPLLLGFASDVFAHQAFTGGSFGVLCPGGSAATGSPAALVSACGAAWARGISLAMSAMVCLPLWAGIHFWLAARTLRTDLDRHYQHNHGLNSEHAASIPAET